ncbi:beta-lactamase/transpeptidase-like protein [Bisporella sp. PMI_857]|nr:beta-lactamase/transpeptidase-like protein [Bisporella sp. PMI_857]
MWDRKKPSCDRRESGCRSWGGYADNCRTYPWESNTIANVFSTTKTVSKYWPRFAANGKQDTQVRHILSHTSGVSGWDELVTIEDLCDFEKATAMLEKQAPYFTLGHLIGKLVRQTTGKTLKQFVREEIAAPLNADFQIGVIDEDLPRVSDIIPFHPPAAPPNLPSGSIAPMTFLNPQKDPTAANSAAWRRAELGASNGMETIDLVQLLSPQTIDLFFREQARGFDLVTGQFLRFSIGFSLTGNGETCVDDWVPSWRVCYWGGFGGSIGTMDLDREVATSYVMIKLENVGLENSRTKLFVKTIYKALDAA